MKGFNVFIRAVGAGIAIAIGCAVYLSCENKALGAFLFSLGLFTVCVFALNLYTGKIAYIIESRNNPNCLIIWFGNLCGALIAGGLLRLAKPAFVEKAGALVTAKLSLSVLQTFILGLFCGMIMYIAVDNYINNKDQFGRYIGILVGIPVFILCGFEHSIADMVYFAAGVTSVSQIMPAAVFIFTVSVANAAGSLALRYITKKER